MKKDLRSYIRLLETQGPEEWVRVRKKISPKYEATAILYKLEREGRYPAVLFENVEGFQIPVIANVHATRRRLALALDVPEAELVEEYKKRESTPIPPQWVGEGPVKEVIRVGEEADLYSLPLLTHFDINTAPYVTAGIVVTKDPVSGVRNLSFHRGMLVAKNRLHMHLAPGMHLVRCQRNAEERNEPLEIAIVLGIHPAFAIGSLALAPFEVDEYDVIGGMLREPVPLVKAETVNVEVPAYAEIVIEGKILPHVREDEGPFGEYSGHSVGVGRHHVVEVTAITQRKEPIYQDIFTGHSEHRLMGAIPRESGIFKAVRAVAPGTRAVHMPVSGCCRFHCYIALDKRTEGEVRNAIFSAFAADLYLKLVVVVDSDVDVYNEREVLWAVANRVQADRDIIVIPNCQGSEIDPSAKKGGITTKMAVDATKKGKDFPERLRVPQEVLDRIKLEDYIGSPSRRGGSLRRGRAPL
ncbi:MAG: UbiD family decarboxylase [Acidobacteria bacterium]|nr:UbiD family decarboxylase [Acidobacteriota bacterium]